MSSSSKLGSNDSNGRGNDDNTISNNNAMENINNDQYQVAALPMLVTVASHTHTHTHLAFNVRF